MSFNQSIYFSLQEPISCQSLCNKINNFISNTDTENCVLEVNIKKITDYSSNPKLGYINSSSPPIIPENNYEHNNQK